MNMIRNYKEAINLPMQPAWRAKYVTDWLTKRVMWRNTGLQKRPSIVEVMSR